MKKSWILAKGPLTMKLTNEKTGSEGKGPINYGAQ